MPDDADHTAPPTQQHDERRSVQARNLLLAVTALKYLDNHAVGISMIYPVYDRLVAPLRSRCTAK